MAEKPDNPDSAAAMPSFVDALERAAQADAEEKPYLGDLPSVEAMLRVAAAKVWPKGEREDPAASQAKLRAVAYELADTFLGKTDQAVPLRNWNEPGSIDVRLAEWCGTEDSTPEGRVAGAFIALMLELADVAVYAGTPGVTQDQWDFQVDGAFQRYAMLFIGISPGTQLQMDREPNPESNFGLDPAECDE